MSVAELGVESLATTPSIDVSPRLKLGCPGLTSLVGSHPGDGQKVKLVNQMLCGVHIAVAAEALAFAEAIGLDARST